MKKLILIVILCSHGVLYSQDISRSTQASAGGNSKNDQGYTLEWSLGGQFSQVVQSDYHLTEGFQQGQLTIDDSPVQAREAGSKMADKSSENSIEQTPWKIKAYPNPSINYLYLDIIQKDFQGAMAYVYDQSGRQVAQQKINSQTTKNISIKSVPTLAPGYYTLQVISLNTLPYSFSFIKAKPKG